MSLIECVPNVSEGIRQDAVNLMAEAIEESGARLLDRSSDRSHNRSVFTFAGDPAAVSRAVHALFDRAIAAIDMRTHRGVHPRLGAVDVVPFVPLRDATLEQCADLSREVAESIAQRHNVPIFLYEAAARLPHRQRLEDIRRGQFEGLALKMMLPEWRPDYGPSSPHPTAGASVFGARNILIAYNVNLATDRLDVARDIAGIVRERSGGLPCVKAMGVALEQAIVQVSMNLTDYRTTSIARAFLEVERLAQARGVEIVESELVGLAPADALPEGTAERVKLRPVKDDRILEHRLQAAGLSS